MSVTFSIVGAPEEREWDEDLKEFVNISPFPEMNLTDTSAEIVLKVLGFELGEECYGEWKGDKELQQVKNRIFKVLNQDKLVRRFVSEPKVEVVENGPTIHESGYSKERIHDYLIRLRALILAAQKNGYDHIMWC
jgi:hypothetical protein